MAILLLLSVSAALAAAQPSSVETQCSSEAVEPEDEFALMQTYHDIRRKSLSALSLRPAAEAEAESYGLAECPCVGIDWPKGEAVVLNLSSTAATYPMGIGSSCQAWDAGRHPSCTGSNPPSWCADAWCFVDACKCNISSIPKTSSYLPNSTYQGRTLYYSYATCGVQDSWTSSNHAAACVNQATQTQCSALSKCAWTGTQCVGKEVAICGSNGNEAVLGKAECRCIGFTNVSGEVAANISGFFYPYPAEVGSFCSAWDNGRNPSCTGSSTDPWCADKWCYVDACSCNLATVPKKLTYFAGASYQGRPLFYSYAACGVKDGYTATKNTQACPNFDATACTQQSHCVWTGSKGCMSKDIASYCAAPANGSASLPPPPPPPPPAAPKPVASGESAAENYGLSACPCIGIDWPSGETIPLNLSNKTVSYPLSMGSSCQAWDAGRHPSCTGSNPPSWCASSWCLVDACKCNISSTPKTSSYLVNSTYQGRTIYYSYATCGAQDSWTSSNHAIACVNQANQSQCKALSKCAWTGTKCVGKEVASCGSQSNEAVLGKAECRCIGFANITGSVSAGINSTFYNYPAEVGSYCSAWDNGRNPSCTGNSKDSWCADNWCYVDACSCNLSTVPKKLNYFEGATYQGRPLFYSYAACGVQDKFTATKNAQGCPNFDSTTCAQQDHCVWTSGRGCMSKDIASYCAAPASDTATTAAPPTTTGSPTTTEAPTTTESAVATGVNASNSTSESGAARLQAVGALAFAIVAAVAARA